MYVNVKAKIDEEVWDEKETGPKQPETHETMKIREFEQPFLSQPNSFLSIFPKTDDPKVSRVFGKVAMFSFGGIGIMGIEHMDELDDDNKPNKDIRI
uniref:Uncharacterized protein n=1 Tax=Acrobeloides nanus TaxID=290746 RepID=A0A914D1P1_9BILA